MKGSEASYSHTDCRFRAAFAADKTSCTSSRGPKKDNDSLDKFMAVGPFSNELELPLMVAYSVQYLSW